MESFIRYLYEYKDEQRVRNVGFVKVDQGEAGGALQIHGRGTFLSNADIRVYLVYTEGKKCCGILMGRLEHVQSILSCRLVYDREEIEQYTEWDSVKGVVLKTNGQGTYAAVWDEGILPLDQMEEAAPREERPSLDENVGKDTDETVFREELEEAEESEQSEKSEEAEESEQSEESKEILEACDGSCSEREVQKRTYCKLMREDMQKLPQKNWYLANNSFLLHGYYNYRHLLLITDSDADGEKTYLGVPGIYHRREEMAARSFGFTEFCRVPNGSIDLLPQECDRGNDFGYWCRELERE